MKTKIKMIAFLEIAIVLCSLFLVALPAIVAEQNQEMQEVSASTITTVSEDDFVLGIYGNANEDDTIDMRDLTYVKLIFFGKKPETELADAKYDGKINPLDFIQIKRIIVGKEKELTFVDVVEEAETIRKPVKGVILTMSDAPDVLRALNAADKIVGITDSVVRYGEVYSLELWKLPRVGKFGDLDHEAVLSLQPDVFIPYTPFATSKSVWPSTKREKAELKEKLPGVSIVALDFVTPSTFTENVRKLGYILDKEDEAEVFADWYDGVINTIKDETKELSEDEKTRIYVMTYSKYETGIPPSRYHQMIDLAGGKNIAADIPIPPGGSTTCVKVDPEWVIEQNPDIIIRRVMETPTKVGYGVDDPAELIAFREHVMSTPELAKVDAVKNGRVYTMSVFMTGPKCIIGIAYYGKWFHPELFKDLDPCEFHQEYLTRFQHLDYDLDKHGVFVYHPVEHPDGR